MTASRAERARAAALLLAGVFAGGSAHALGSCSVAAQPVVFGSFAMLGVSPRDGVGSISVSCLALTLPLAEVPFTVSIGPSSHSGTFARRLSRTLGGVLPYQLYRDAGRTQVWGDGSSGTLRMPGSVTPAGLNLLVTATLTVYGRIPAGHVPAAGAYADALTVTVDY